VMFRRFPVMLCRQLRHEGLILCDSSCESY
jgi:hypothetical protein